MSNKTAPVAILLGCALTASGQPLLSEFEAARATFSHAGEMDLEDGPGSLNISRFDIRSVLSKPISPIEGLTVIPMFEYRLTDLDFDGIAPTYPIHDEELHSLSLSAMALYKTNDSPWIYGGWARAKMSSDFQDVDGDDFKFDLAAGAGYTFTDRFVLGFGAALVNINGDAGIYPGPFFNWDVSESVRLGLYGPVFIASYTPVPDWIFSLRADSAGDSWNISDDDGASRSVDLTSYRVGLYANRRLTENLWLRAGAGITFGNEIELTRPNGRNLFAEDLDSGLFGQVSLRLMSW
jgi:hypothetical protein